MLNLSALNHLHSGIVFMDSRNKGDLHDLVGHTVHIKDFAFLNQVSPQTGEMSRFAVFIIEEDNNNFYFGSKPISEVLSLLEKDGVDLGELSEVPVKVKHGITRKEKYDFIYFEFPED